MALPIIPIAAKFFATRLAMRGGKEIIAYRSKEWGTKGVLRPLKKLTKRKGTPDHKLTGRRQKIYKKENFPKLND